MGEKNISIENLKFLLHQVHGIKDLFAHDYYSAYNQETVDMIIDTAIDFSNKELFPYFTEMDRLGATYSKGQVNIHPQVYRVLNLLGEAGVLNATLSFEQGGMQLPYMVHYAAGAIYTAANNGGIGYAMLTAGAAKLILSFGNKALKKTYAEKMYKGIWQGTMAMTEPEAGSSLSDLITKAVPVGDGTYKIIGQKIFISGGDYTDTENDFGHSVAIDSQDNVLITGGTRSTDFPHLNGFDVTQNGDSDAFVSKFNSSGELIWSSFLGGTGHDIALSVAINSQDRVVVTGDTDSSDFFVFNGLDETHNGGFDAFVTMYNSSGGLIESTFLGGSSYETANSIAIDSKNSTIVAGETFSSDFPVNGHNKTINGDQDVFLCRLTTTPLLYDDDVIVIIIVEEFNLPISFFVIGSFALLTIFYRRKKHS